MSVNPLHNYFRQPKLFLKLPSLGKYNDSSSITGDVENLPIYGMTGMDQILIKTPDALLNGESTVNLIKSCCPNIIDPWKVTNIDINSLLAAIRIASFGNTLSISSTCGHCNTENEYEIDVSFILEHYSKFTFNSTCNVGDLIIKIKPLSYKEMTAFSMETFVFQKQLSQAELLDDEKLKQDEVSKIYQNFAKLQNKILVNSIEFIETPTSVVSEFGFIKEWVDNCEHSNLEVIKKHIDTNMENLKVPLYKVQCSECKGENNISVDLDYSNFFVKA